MRGDNCSGSGVVGGSSFDCYCFCSIVGNEGVPKESGVVHLVLAVRLDISRYRRTLHVSNESTLCPEVEHSTVVLFTVSGKCSVCRLSRLLTSTNRRPLG